MKISFKTQPDILKNQVQQLMRENYSQMEQDLVDKCTKKVDEKYKSDFNYKLKKVEYCPSDKDLISILSSLKDAYKQSGLTKDVECIDNIKRNPNPLPQSEEDIKPKSEYELPIKYGFNLKDTIISKEDLKTLKFYKNEFRLKDIVTEIKESSNMSRTMQFVKILGQRGYLSYHAEAVEPKETEHSTLTKRKTEAYLKIQVRNNYTFNRQH